MIHNEAMSENLVDDFKNLIPFVGGSVKWDVRMGKSIRSCDASNPLSLNVGEGVIFGHEVFNNDGADDNALYVSSGVWYITIMPASTSNWWSGNKNPFLSASYTFTSNALLCMFPSMIAADTTVFVNFGLFLYQCQTLNTQIWINHYYPIVVKIADYELN